MFQFKAEPSPHYSESNGQMCIQLKNPKNYISGLVRSVVMTNFTDSPEYKLKSDAGAFLQADYETYLLVEFWKKDYQPFIDFVNEKLRSMVDCPHCGEKTLNDVGYCFNCWKNFELEG